MAFITRRISRNACSGGAEDWSPVCWRQLKRVHVYQETLVVKKDMVVEFHSRHCSQRKAEENLEQWQHRVISEGQACWLSCKIPGRTKVPHNHYPSSFDLFYLTNQMRCGNLDVYSEKPVYDDTGVLLMTGQSKQPRKSTIVLISGPGLALDRSLVFRPLRCVPLGCQHKLHHLWPLFQLGPQRYSGISGTLKLGHPSA